MRWLFHPLKLVACLLLIGISLYSFFPIPLEFVLCVTLFIILLVIVFLKVKRLQKFRVPVLCIAIIFLGYSLISVSVYELDSKDSVVNFVSPKGGVVICEGVLKDVRGSLLGQRLIVDELRCLKEVVLVPLVGKARLSIIGGSQYAAPVFRKGDVVRFQAKIKRPRDYRNYNLPRYEKYCFSKGISAVGYVAGPSWIVKIGNRSGVIDNMIYSWRASVSVALLKGLGDTDRMQLIKAFILGDMSGFEEKVTNIFKVLGIIHLLVVSGLHVTVLAGVSWWCVIFIGSLFSLFWGQRDMRLAASFVSLIVIWVFIALTGFGIPAIRAGIVASIYLLAIFFKKLHDPWDSLALAAILILVVDPPAAFNISFQLTFAAVVGILSALRFLFRVDERDGRLLKFACYMGNLGFLSLGAFLGVFPLLAYHFGMVPAMGPVVSIVMSPVVTAAFIPFSLVAALITPLSVGLGAHLFGLLSWPADAFLRVSEILADHLAWSVVGTKVGLMKTLGLYVVIILTIYWRSFKKRKIVLASALIFIGLGIFMPQHFEISDDELAVTFLDVGQGAAVVVRLPNGNAVLIDGGGIKGSSIDLGEIVLRPFLESIGIKEIERVIITHPHPDHFKGLGYIITEFKPRVCMVGSFPKEALTGEDASEWSKFLEMVIATGVDIERLVPSRWEDGGVEFSVFSPPQDIPDGWSINDASGVIRLEYNGVSFLITGDVEVAAERYLVENEFDLSSTVLQVPHHGSLTSSSNAFLDQVLPRYGVVQVGAFNQFGFPEEDVLERLTARDVKIYRTDRDGAVTFVTDGSEIKVFLGIKR